MTVKLSDIVLSIFYHRYFPTAITSSIIQRNSVHHQHLSRMLIEEGYDSSLWIPCYVALRHGWNVSSFHELCDNMAPTLTIVRKDNYVFGGFTENSWAGNHCRRLHLKCFLYINQVHIVRLLAANKAVFPHSSRLEKFRVETSVIRPQNLHDDDLDLSGIWSTSADRLLLSNDRQKTEGHKNLTP